MFLDMVAGLAPRLLLIALVLFVLRLRPWRWLRPWLSSVGRG